MKAFRNINGNVVEIVVDVDRSGNPILPPDTTVDPRPEDIDGHYLTVVGNSWIHIERVVQEVTLEQKKTALLESLRSWRNRHLDLPVEHNGIIFDADETARARLSQAVVVGEVSGNVPPAWVAADNSLYPLENYEALKALAIDISVAFSTRFFEASALRTSIEEAESEEALAAIELPDLIV